MVDSEKPKMMDEQNQEDESVMKGGENQTPAPEETNADQQVNDEPETVEDFRDNPFAEDSEYSEEEYKKFVELYDRTLAEIKQGEIVTGRILAKTDNEVLVDIGFKSEGSIPLEEFNDPDEIKIGDEIEVFLEDIENTDGQLILSKKKAQFMRLWDQVVDTFHQGGTIEGKCVRRIKGGIVVDLQGVDAFLPGSQIDVKPIRDFDSLIGQTFTFKIVKVNRPRRNIVVSRRALLEESLKEQRKDVLENIEKGMICEGVVKNITDFGVFVDLGGVDGLLHINDLSWGRIRHPSEVVKLDEKIKVVVLDFNDAKDRISLGMKQLTDHPWKEVEEKYPEGSIVSGKVVSITDYGAFVELEKGVEGLIHVSEMSWTRHGIHPSKIVSVGETVEVKVLNVDKEKKRISLGLKQLTEDPWKEIEKRFPVGTKIKGTVRNMTNFGVFVEVEEGIDGLIHISDLSWTKKIKHPSEVLRKGEEVEVVVLEINKDERRISLGYKQLQEDPWPVFEEKYKVGSETPAKVVRFVDKGIIVELPLGLEGFVPASQMVESSMEKIAKSLKEGDELKLTVIEFDRKNKRVVLSEKEKETKKKKEAEAKEKEEVEKFLKEQDQPATLGEIAGHDAAVEEPEKKTESNEDKTEEKKEETEDKAEKSEESDDSEEKKDDAPAES